MTQFIWPVTDHHILGDPFGARGGEHKGQDIGVSVGTVVMASAPGRIIFAGMSGGYGNLIRIQHDNGFETRYGHLSTIVVTEGQYVSQRYFIGRSGGAKGALGSGDSNGPHLHFEIRYNGAAVNPIPYLNPGTTPSQQRRKQMFGFVRNPGGEIAIVNPATGTKRPLGYPEWTGYSVNGATYAQLTDAEYNSIPNAK